MVAEEGLTVHPGAGRCGDRLGKVKSPACPDPVGAGANRERGTLSAELSLDTAFVLIEGHSPKNSKGVSFWRPFCQVALRS
jgi:hypothetical protein